MTVYWRSAHERVGRSGGTHWVCGHWVTRGGGAGSGCSTSSGGGGELSPSPCPRCGDEVYFYESPYGGRVYFDAPGPPWPKHPCFPDMRGESRAGSSSRSSPGEALEALGIGDWLSAIVFARADEAGLANFVLTFADSGVSPVLFATEANDDLPAAGQRLCLRGDWISYIGATDLKPRYARIARKPVPPWLSRNRPAAAPAQSPGGGSALDDFRDRLSRHRHAIEQAVLAIFDELRRAAADTSLDQQQLRELTVAAVREPITAACAAARKQPDGVAQAASQAEAAGGP